MANSNASAQARPVAASPGPLGLLTSSIGQKAVMTVTRAILVGFVIAHFLGNALLWLGPAAINEYSAALHNAPALLWLARSILIVAVVLHIVVAVRLASTNMAARPHRYRMKKDAVTNYAARTMVWSGPILLAFIVYHLAHLTFGITPGPYAHSYEDVYSNLINGFSIWWVSALYIVSMVGLGYHLFHGVWSMFQSLGIQHPTYNRRLERLSVGIALFVTLGNISIPLSVLLGFGR